MKTSKSIYPCIYPKPVDLKGMRKKTEGEEAGEKTGNKTKTTKKQKWLTKSLPLYLQPLLPCDAKNAVRQMTYDADSRVIQ